MSDVIKALTIAPHGATHIGFYGDDIIFIKEHEEARSDAWGVNSKQWQEIEDFDVSLIYGIRAIKDVKIEAELLKQIEQIKAERDELASQLIAVKEGSSTGQSPCAKFCESVALRKDFDQLREHADKMKVERDALAAQVARLDNSESILIDERDGLEIVCDKLSSAIASFFNVEFGDHSSANCPWFEAQALIEQHSLAEIRAEAGRDGFVAGSDAFEVAQILGSDFDVEASADEYAAKVRQGGE